MLKVRVLKRLMVYLGQAHTTHTCLRRCRTHPYPTATSHRQILSSSHRITHLIAEISQWNHKETSNRCSKVSQSHFSRRLQLTCPERTDSNIVSTLRCRKLLPDIARLSSIIRSTHRTCYRNRVALWQAIPQINRSSRCSSSNYRRAWLSRLLSMESKIFRFRTVGKSSSNQEAITAWVSSRTLNAWMIVRQLYTTAITSWSSAQSTGHSIRCN